MLKIFVDTNVLIHSTEWKVRVTESIDQMNIPKYELIIHPLVFHELMQASEEGGKLGKMAKLALHLASNYTFFEDDLEYAGTDVAILEAAAREQGVVLTFDKKLRERCQERDIPILYAKRHGGIQLIGYIKDSNEWSLSHRTDKDN